MSSSFQTASTSACRVQCLIARGKLADDQVELVFEDVVLLRLCVLLKLGKFLTDLGHGRFKSLGVGLGHLGQQLGDVVGQLGIGRKAVVAVDSNLVAVRAERGNVAGQRIAGLSRVKPSCRRSWYFSGCCSCRTGCC